MSLLFDRRCRVTVGPSGGDGIQVDERFRIEFRVIRTVGREMNTMTAAIYGLSERTRAELMQFGRDAVLQVEAGYRDGLEVLAIADVTRKRIRRAGTEIISEIECEDGARLLRDRKINLSFAAGTPVERVLARIAEELAVGVRETGVVVAGEYLEGVSFSGPVGEVLDKVTGKAGVTWSIQDGMLQILDRVAESQDRGMLITPETGLLGSPERIEEEDRITERRRGVGYRIRTLLRPKARPGERLVLRAADVDEVLRIDSLEHTGDTRGETWVTEIEAYAQLD